MASDGELIGLAASTIRKLKLGSFMVRVNNRKLLAGLYEELGVADQSVELLRIIDKLDKIGETAVRTELTKLGLTSTQVDKLLTMAELSGSVDKTLTALRALGISNTVFVRGLEELERGPQLHWRVV